MSLIKIVILYITKIIVVLNANNFGKRKNFLFKSYQLKQYKQTYTVSYLVIMEIYVYIADLGSVL